MRYSRQPWARRAGHSLPATGRVLLRANQFEASPHRHFARAPRPSQERDASLVTDNQRVWNATCQCPLPAISQLLASTSYLAFVPIRPYQQFERVSADKTANPTGQRGEGRSGTPPQG
ncbi:hypothetical protein CALVIDRAFT_341306 [Calocera viscosa TUFC12733]|uniref:Uncharacterized protein n=1 Tax=Calocera viscosa (strain TUFC12733) TaxID=1330018 RepID=A0A167HED8_CALVF|nr:hypothetical protein CALVIDRAFT_341306 [Calocera viscosa TUFC12733]